MIKTEYQIATPCKPFTLAIVADLHERQPDEVLSILSSVHPDYILVPGDLLECHGGENLDREDENGFSRFVCRIIHGIDHFVEMHPRLFRRKKSEGSKENAYRFLREAGKLAPVIMSIGNHELRIDEEGKRAISESGTILLDDEMVEMNGILFGGLSSKCVRGKLNTAFLEQFAKQTGFKVLLCHHPEYFPQLKGYPIDLIVSGHAHGGQWRFFHRGFFSPGQGLFPKYTKGVYEGRLVVSAGCSNTAAIPRINNPMEVAVVRGENQTLRFAKQRQKKIADRIN